MALSGLQIFKLLPKTNCKDCGFPTCMAFAMQLASGKAELSQCPHVSAEAAAELGEAAAPPVRKVTIRVNGESLSAVVEPRLLLAHLLRQGFKLTGTHTGCDTSNCGACTVLFDGQPVKSCTMFAVQADGHEVMTIEGLAGPSELHAIQEGFKEEHGLQCGFCTPGMMMTSKALLDENPNPTEDEIRWALSGNLCRCTGYQNIVKAVMWAATKLQDQ